MALTKEDLKEIKKITDKAVDNLALITKRGFDDVDKRFDDVDKRFEAVDGQFKTIDGQFKTIDGQFDEIKIILGNHSAHFTQIEKSLENLENRHHELFLQVQGMDDKLAFMGDHLKKIENRLTAVEKRLIIMEKRLNNMEDRMDVLENKVDDLTAELKAIRCQLNQNITEDQYEIIEKRVLRLEQAVGLAV